MKKNELISFDKISYLQWLVLGVAFILFVIGLVVFYFPFLAERHFREGFNLNAAGQNKFAIEELEQAIYYAPWETQYYVQLGKTYEDYASQLQVPSEQLTQLKKAEALYLHIIQLDPINPWFRNRLATIYLYYSSLIPKEQMKYISLAEESTKKASELDHKNPLFQLSMAYFYHRLNRLDQAQAYYEKVLSLDPDLFEASYNLADIYRRKGDTKKQFDLYEQIYQKAPDYQNVAFLLAYRDFQNNQAQKAIPVLEQILQKDPYKIEVLDLLSTIYHKQGQLDKAIPLYERALLKYPDHDMLWKNYIQALAQANRISDAIDQAKNFLLRKPNDPQIIQLLNALYRRK